MSLALATVADVAAVSKAVPQSEVARVQRLIELVSARVAKRTKQSFVEATETITITPRGDGVVRLPQRPVSDVASVVRLGVTLPEADYTVTPEGYLTRALPTSSAINAADVTDRDRVWSAVPLTVTYTHGYPAGEYPDDLAGVVAEKVAVKWLSGQRLAEGVQSESIDGYSQTFANLAHVSAGNAWDPEHLEILDLYGPRRTGSVRIL